LLPEGAHLVEHLRDQPPMIGHVSSSYHSPNIGRSVALALVKGGRARIGRTIHAPLEGKTLACKVTEPIFFDPSGERLRG